jgi:drug/metabolite transporter (DMT)-like permease
MSYGLIAALAWGISTIAATQATRRVGTYTALLVSQLLGAGCLGLLAVVMRPPLAGLHGLTLAGLAAAGLFSLAGWATYYLALEAGPVGVVSAVAASYGGIAAVLAVLVLGEHLGRAGGAGVILVVAGVGLAVAQVSSGSGAAGQRSGIMLALLSAATYGVFSFLLGGFSAHVGWLAAALATYGSSVAALLAGLPFRRARNRRARRAAPRDQVTAGIVPWPGPAPVHHDLAGGDWPEPARPAGDCRPGRAAPAGYVVPSANGSSARGLASRPQEPGYRSGLGWAAAAGLTEAVALAVFSRGGEAGLVALTAAVASLYPVIPLAAGVVLFRERLRWRQVLGVACIVAGLVMISLGKDAMGMMLAPGQAAMARPLVAVSGILGLAAAVPMTVRVTRGKTRPQPASWGSRAGLMILGGVAAVAAGMLPAAAFGLGCGAAAALIAVLALRIPAARREKPARIPLWPGVTARPGLICLAGGLASLALLAVARDPDAAVAAAVATGLIAYAPARVRAWRAPGGGLAAGNALFIAVAAAALAAAAQARYLLVAAAIAYPLYEVAADGVAAVLAAARRPAAGSPGSAGRDRVVAGTVPLPGPAPVHHDVVDGDLSEPAWRDLTAAAPGAVRAWPPGRATAGAGR